MAYLNKEAYEAKREWAANRMAENAKIDTLTEEQHEALSNLCEFRHMLHCNQKSLFYTESSKYEVLWKELFSESLTENSLIETFKRLKLGTPFTVITAFDIPDNDSDFNDYEDYDEDGNLVYDADIDCDDDKWQDKHDYNLEQIIKLAENINDEIESFLQNIDDKYRTNYCPSGQSRIF